MNHSTVPQEQQQNGHGIVQVAMQFNSPISCMAWSQDGQQLALAAHGSYDVEVWQTCQSPTGTAWLQLAVLRGHSMPISGLDWNNTENMLVSCSYDRTAFLWHWDGHSKEPGACSLPGSNWTVAASGWHGQLVETRLKRGCTCVQWSPSDKYEMAVGSAGRALTVLAYDQQLGVWSSRQVARAATTSVTCVAWHPRVRILAAGSTDNCVRLFSARAAATEVAHDQLTDTRFGQLLCTVAATPAPGWLHALAWTPTGNQLLCCSHNSQLLVCDLNHMLDAVPAAANNAAVQVLEPAPTVTVQPTAVLQLPGCPLKTLTMLSDTVAVGGGWDGVIQLFTGQQGHGANAGSWCLQYLLGRFMPGQQPPMSPAYLPCKVATVHRTGPQQTVNLNKQLHNMSLYAQSGDGTGDTYSLAAWEQVLEGTVPAHEACMTMLACIPQPTNGMHDDIHASPWTQPDQSHGRSPARSDVLGQKPTGSWGAQAVIEGRHNVQCSTVSVASCGLDGKMIVWHLPAL